MLPGKKYTVEDLIFVLRRRYWLLVVPFAVVGALAAGYARTLPNVYGAETVILVVPQRVPESYVQPTVSTRIEDRLQSITPTILSRTRLERVIEEFNLYPEERRTGVMEDVVTLMKANIHPDVLSKDTFRVRYTGNDPVLVMKVTDRLASLFIDESLRDRQLQAEGTDQFLESQLEEARNKLLENERRLEVWRRTYAGELPTQIDANLQQMQNAQMQLRDTREDINRNRERRLLLESQLGELQTPGMANEPAMAPGPAADAAAAAGTSSTAQQLQTAQALLASQEQRGLKPGHPDLEASKRRIRDLEGRLAAETARSVVPGPGPVVTLSPAEAARLRRIESLKADMLEIDKQIARKQDEEKRLQTAAADTQRRIDAMPTRESEMTELMRDHGTLQSSYESLLSNKQRSQMAANLERRQIGESFKLLDPAQLPEKPISPDRAKINLYGMLVGFIGGVVLVGLLEYRDTSFKTDADITAVLALPVLAVVPLMQSESDRRRAMWQWLAVTAGLGSVVAGSLAFVAYTWVR